MIYKSSNITQIDEDVESLKTSMGNTSISSVGDGTVTGAIAEIAKATIVAGNVPPVIKSFTITPTTDIYDISDGTISIGIDCEVIKKSKDITSIVVDIQDFSGNSISTIPFLNVENGGTFNTTYLDTNPTESVKFVLCVNDGATDTVKEEIKVYIVNKTYYGLVPDTVNSSNISSSDITALSNVILKSGSYTYSGINATAQRIVYAYPKINQELESIIDANGINYISSFDKVTVNINSASYYAYVSKDPITIADATLNFKEKGDE